MLVFQLDESGARACCCNKVSSDQAGPAGAALPVGAALAGMAGLGICAKPEDEKISRAAMVASPTAMRGGFRALPVTACLFLDKQRNFKKSGIEAADKVIEQLWIAGRF